MRQDFKFTIPNIEEEHPSQIGEFDHSASIIVPADNNIDPYGDDTKFNGFDEEIPRRNGGQKQINSIEEVTEQETLNTFESERQDIENFLNEMPTRQIAMTYSSNRRRWKIDQ